MTVFNRIDKTVACVQSLLSSQLGGVKLTIFVTDAGHDGTSSAIAKIAPNAKTQSVPGDTYWAAGMRSAWEMAQACDYDVLMWLNDDVVLFEDWLERITEHTRTISTDSVLAGGCVDPGTGQPSYGGFRAGPKMTPLRFEVMHANGTPTRCDTINGNVILVTRSLDQSLGGFPEGYAHNLADLAYGLSATRSGAEVVLASNPVGTCERDTAAPAKSVSGWSRVRHSLEVKNFPPRQWLKFCWSYGGPLWPLHFMRPYIRAFVGKIDGATADAGRKR
ncbi:MAG: glycosyltransferase family 2 protein [Gordonia polyisoprenivorans]|nr:glycosyltransferase family 2 protein [Gordonia polyisoprenivorans]